MKVCLYFHVHQPFRLRDYTVFDISKRHDYFDGSKNRQVLEKVVKKCYLPATNMFLWLLRTYPSFKVSFSFSGTILEQLDEHYPYVIDLFREMIGTGRVEILDETYYHSLSSIYSQKDFREQVQKHRVLIKKIFDYEPVSFRNTELIFSNEIAAMVEGMGYSTVIAEGWDKNLGWRSPNYLYRPRGSKINLLLKNYKLSDDIAFRFSNREWNEYPLTADKYSQWINSIEGDTINLFMDYETIGEHQWHDTGIFDFFKSIVHTHLIDKNNSFILPRDSKHLKCRDEVDFPYPVSWADTERDTSAWNGNTIQQSALNKIYGMEDVVKKSADKSIIQDWLKLTTSDHYYYMCTKYFNDGDVHKYFSPYDSPYDVYLAMMNVINDLSYRLGVK